MEEKKVVYIDVPGCTEQMEDLARQVAEKIENGQLGGKENVVPDDYARILSNTQSKVDFMRDFYKNFDQPTDEIAFPSRFINGETSVVFSSEEGRDIFLHEIEELANRRHVEQYDTMGNAVYLAGQIQESIDRAEQRNSRIERSHNEQADMLISGRSTGVALVAALANDYGVSVHVADNRESGNATVEFDSMQDYMRVFMPPRTEVVDSKQVRAEVKEDLGSGNYVYAMMITANTKVINFNEQGVPTGVSSVTEETPADAIRKTNDLLLKADRDENEEQVVADFMVAVRNEAQDIITDMQRTGNDVLINDINGEERSSQIAYALDRGGIKTQHGGVATPNQKATMTAKALDIAKKMYVSEMIRHQAPYEARMESIDEKIRMNQEKLRLEQEEQERKRLEEEQKRLEEEREKEQAERRKRMEAMTRAGVGLMIFALEAGYIKEMAKITSLKEMSKAYDEIGENKSVPATGGERTGKERSFQRTQDGQTRG